MYEIKENRRRLKDGTEISTYTRDVVSCNILEVEAGTTGYRQHHKLKKKMERNLFAGSFHCVKI